MIRQGNAAPRRTQPSPVSQLGDHYRALLRGLRTSSESGFPPRLIGVTSCRHGEGVSTVAVNLALHAARDLDQHTLLLDLSPGQDSVARTLGSPPRLGFSDMLFKGVEPSECIRAGTAARLAVLGSGALSGGGRDTFETHQAAGLLSQLKSAYQLVIVDLPTATAVSGCYDLAGVLDGILLVVEAEGVRGQVAAHVKEQLVKAGAKMLGVVLNKRRQHVPGWLYRRL